MADNDSTGEIIAADSPKPAVIHRHHVAEDERPSVAVIAALSRVKGLDPTEMPPIGRSVDLDAVDTLLISATDNATSPSISFAAEGYHVELTATEVVVRSATNPTRSE